MENSPRLACSESLLKIKGGVMNIRKLFNKVFFISAAFFWASCSDDISNSNPVNLQSPDSQGQDIQQPESSSSVSSSSQEDEQSESSSSIASSSSRQRTCSEKTVFNRIPEEGTSNLTKINAIKNAESSARSLAAGRVMHEVYSRPNACSDKYPKGTPFCLSKMADSLAEFSSATYLYGSPSFDIIIKELVCDDGTTYVTEQYRAYEKLLEEYENKLAIYQENYKQAYDKRVAEYTALLDSCINHPDDFNPTDEDELKAYNESICDVDAEEDS